MFATGELKYKERGIYWKPTRDIEIKFGDVSVYKPKYEETRWGVVGQIKF